MGRYVLDSEAVTEGALIDRVLRMTDVPFFVVTVDYVPDYLRHLEVTKMAAEWNVGAKPQEAVANFKDYAIKEGYDGIIGLQYSNYARSSSGGPLAVSSTTSYFVYGTMVMFR